MKKNPAQDTVWHLSTTLSGKNISLPESLSILHQQWLVKRLFCRFQRFYICADSPICTKQPSCKQASLYSRRRKMSEQKVWKWQINLIYSKNVMLKLEFHRHWLSTDFYSFIGDWSLEVFPLTKLSHFSYLLDKKYFLYNFKYVYRELSSTNITVLFDLE